jgi:hypothetical protein
MQLFPNQTMRMQLAEREMLITCIYLSILGRVGLSKTASVAWKQAAMLLACCKASLSMINLPPHVGEWPLDQYHGNRSVIGEELNMLD